MSARPVELEATRFLHTVGWAFALTPLLTQPIVNPDFLSQPPGSLAIEVAGNYLPAAAILVGLWLLHAGLARVWPAIRPWLLAPLTGLVAAAAVAAIASAAVYRLHMRLVSDVDTSLPVYLQRNLGFTAIIVLPVLLLERHRLRAQAAERRLAQEQRHALKAQLEVLQSRTQPHFLFNVLNTIASLIRDDAALAELTVYRLAELLRYALESSRVERVSLARELEIVVAYLEVQRARFGERLRYDLAIEPGAEVLGLPPFVLQPLVENAVVHAVAPRARGGSVTIRAARRGARLELGVDDDGPGPGASTHVGTRTGLAEMRARLELIHGDDATLAVRRNERGGFTAELGLPAEAA